MEKAGINVQKIKINITTLQLLLCCSEF